MTSISARRKSPALLVWLLLLGAQMVSLGVQAVDYPGGWVPGAQQCVDICAHSSPTPVCPTHDPACLAKKQRPGDFDFLVLEQLFLPQFCRDLLVGVDPTLSHKNVNKFPRGIVCEPSKAPSKLSIHGLWPNYDTGFPACCNISDSIRNQPFDPHKLAASAPDLLAELGQVWVDPTQPSAFRTLCELYNHEFQKHGLCYAADGGNDLTRNAQDYFQAALRAASTTANATTAVQRWASSTSPQTTLEAISSLYGKRVQVLCSAVEPVRAPGIGTRSIRNSLAAIRTCFVKPSTNSTAELVAVDCGPAVSSPAFTPCDSEAPITLEAYSVPSPLTALEL